MELRTSLKNIFEKKMVIYRHQKSKFSNKTSTTKNESYYENERSIDLCRYKDIKHSKLDGTKEILKVAASGQWHET